MPHLARKPRTAALRMAGLKGISVDADNGVIRNAAVATLGPARGHGFELDMTSLRQLCDLINSEPDGYKIHFKHPRIDNGQMEDQLGAMVGRLKNARIDGDACRADVHLGAYAKSLPGYGDAWTYLLGVAQDDPAAIGLSAVFAFEVEPIGKDPAKPERLCARISRLFQVDFVGEPAANPNGLLAAVPEEPSGVLVAINACVAACRTCLAECRACQDAIVALNSTAETMATVVAAAGRTRDCCRSMITAARACIDACDGAGGVAEEPAVSEAASLCIRLCGQCAEECREARDAMRSMQWGTSELARSCAAAVPVCRTCVTEMFLCQDACEPLTAPVARFNARRTAAADVRAMARR